MATKNELAAVENKIPDANSLVQKTDLNAKISELENKIPNITGLATNSALTAVENKIPDASGLVKTQIIIQIVKLKRQLLIITMTNTLLLQNLII